MGPVVGYELILAWYLLCSVCRNYSHTWQKDSSGRSAAAAVAAERTDYGDENDEAHW